MNAPLVPGSVVRVRDEPSLHIVREVNGDRILVSPMDWPWPVVPIGCVHIDDVIDTEYDEQTSYYILNR